MKKITLFVAAIAMVLTFASCKKTYHCECTGGGVTAKGASITGSKKDMDSYKTTCEGSTVGGVTCKLVEE